MLQLFQNILPIFLSILLGSILKKQWITTEEFWRGLEKLTYFVLFPATLFTYIVNANFAIISTSKLILTLIIASSIVSIILIGLQKKLTIDKVVFTSIFQGGIRYNTYIFFALGSALFNEVGLTTVSIISGYMIIFTNILSIIVFNIYVKKQDSSKNWISIISHFKSNPLIISSIAGFILNYLNIHMPQSINKFFEILGNGALVTGTLTVGAGLKFIIHPQQIKYIFIATISKLCIFPIVTVILLKMLSVSGIAGGIGLLYSCLPCASSSYVLSRQLGGDPDSMATIITISTICSLLSLSFLMHILFKLIL